MLAARLLRSHGRQLPSRQATTAPSSLVRPSIRTFHATVPRKDVSDVVLYLPHEMLQSLHAYLPWYAAIPVSAFIVRGLLVATFGSYVRSLTARYVALNPLRHATSLQIRDRMMRNGSFESPRHARTAIALEIKKQTTALDRRWSCTLKGQIGWTVAQLPLFLIMAEAIRRMSATKDGLLKMGLSALGLDERSNTDVGYLQSEYSADVDINAWFEPSLAAEGMLWFPDLLTADPSGVLPFIVSGLMFTNIYNTKNASGNLETAKPWQKGLRQGMLGISLLIGPLCQDVPAGLLLYWASSTTAVMAWNVWLDWKHPILTGFGPCKRPLQTMPSKKTPTSTRRR